MTSWANVVAIAGAIGSLATAVGVVVAAVQLRHSRKQARADFEHKFVERYWQILDEHLRGETGDDVYRKRYLRLCEDEFEAKRLAQISAETWKVWHLAIRSGADGFRGTLGDKFEWLARCLGEPDPHPSGTCPGLDPGRDVSSQPLLRVGDTPSAE